jgi:hypothetical protein
MTEQPSGPTPAELLALQQQQATAQAQQAIAEAQQKIAEAQKGRVAAQAQTAQALAEAKQKTAEAERAALLAQLPASTVKGLEGATAADDQSGYVATLAAYEAMQRSATAIAAELKAALSVGPEAKTPCVLIVSDLALASNDLVRLPLAQTMTFLHDLLAKQAKRNDAAGQAAIKQSEELAKDVIRTASLAPALLAAPVVLQALISSAADLASYFQSNFSVTGQTIDLSREAVVNAVAAALRPISTTLFQFHLIETSTVVTALAALLDLKQTLIVNQQALRAKGIDPLAKAIEHKTNHGQKLTAAFEKLLKGKDKIEPEELTEADEAIKTVENQIQAATPVLHDAQAADKETTSLIEAVDAFVKNVTTPPAAGEPAPLTQAALYTWIHDQPFTHLLWIKPASSGGDLVTQRQWFRSGHVSYVGGGVLSYVLSTRDGEVVRSGMHSALSQISRVLTANRDFQLLPVNLVPVSQKSWWQRFMDWLGL